MDSVAADAGAARGSTREVLKQAIVVDADKVKSHLDEVARSTVEETRNQLLDEKADRGPGAGRYERSADRQDTRAGSYRRKLETKAGAVTLAGRGCGSCRWRRPSSSGPSAGSPRSRRP